MRLPARSLWSAGEPLSCRTLTAARREQTGSVPRSGGAELLRDISPMHSAASLRRPLLPRGVGGHAGRLRQAVHSPAEWVHRAGGPGQRLHAHPQGRLSSPVPSPGPVLGRASGRLHPQHAPASTREPRGLTQGGRWPWEQCHPPPPGTLGSWGVRWSCFRLRQAPSPGRCPRSIFSRGPGTPRSASAWAAGVVPQPAAARPAAALSWGVARCAPHSWRHAAPASCTVDRPQR